MTKTSRLSFRSKSVSQYQKAAIWPKPGSSTESPKIAFFKLAKIEGRPYLATAAALIFLFLAAPLQAQIPAGNQTSQEKVSIPEGMEEYTISDLKLIVPRGIRITRQGGNHLILENTDEYAARQLSEMQKQLQQAEERVQSLQERVEKLEEALKR